MLCINTECYNQFVKVMLPTQKLLTVTFNVMLHADNFYCNILFQQCNIIVLLKVVHVLLHDNTFKATMLQYKLFCVTSPLQYNVIIILIL